MHVLNYLQIIELSFYLQFKQICNFVFPRLSQICHIRQLTKVVQYNLFPSADMILSMSKEYGTYAEQWEQKTATKTEVHMPSLPVHMKTHALLDTHNRDFRKWKHNVQHRDFIQVCREKTR